LGHPEVLQSSPDRRLSVRHLRTTPSSTVFLTTKIV